MEEILKLLLQEILSKDDRVEKIETVKELCDAAWDRERLIRIFAANNDDRDGFSTEEILEIANEAYQEVCANA